MIKEVLQGLMIPFAGTTAGAACVLFMKNKLSFTLQRGLIGFASGVMVAASIWSLLIPAMEQEADLGRLSFIPAVIGFWFGILFLLLLDRTIPHLHINNDEAEGIKSSFSKTLMMVLAVILHNIPEGMAVGVVFAGCFNGSSNISIAGAFSLSIGIAIQNFPEGAIVSMPLRTEGFSKQKAFLYGILSGVVEPIAGLVTVFVTSSIISVLPYLLSFAAGAMIYVVVEELIPEMSAGHHSNLGTIFFAVGFTLMLAMDVGLGS